MDLHNGNITLQNILRHPGAAEVLRREFPELYGGALFRLAQSMSLNAVLRRAHGKVPREKVQRVIDELKSL